MSEPMYVTPTDPHGLSINLTWSTKGRSDNDVVKYFKLLQSAKPITSLDQGRLRRQIVVIGTELACRLTATADELATARAALDRITQTIVDDDAPGLTTGRVFEVALEAYRATGRPDSVREGHAT